MDFQQAEAIRAKLRAGMTTGEAIAGRYREATLDTPESIHRAVVSAETAMSAGERQRCAPRPREPDDEAEQIAALVQRSETGWAPRKGQIV